MQVSSARARQEGDFQLVIPSVPIDSIEKHDIDYELILQVISFEVINKIDYIKCNVLQYDKR